jgi:putative peptidoglycan lipid II flippase
MTRYFKLFNKLEKNFHLGKATLIIAVLTLVSRMIGFLRDLLLAKQLGISSETDIYFTAFRIPDLIYNLLILGTLSAAFIPVFTSYYLKDKKEAWGIANGILNSAVFVIVLICIIIFFFTEPLTKILAPGFTPEQIHQTAQLTKIFLISPILFTISSVFSSSLLSLKKFIWVNMAPLFYNAGIIVGIIWLYPIMGLSGIAWGVILGALLHALIQLPQLIVLGFTWRPKFNWKHRGIKKIGGLFLPRVLGLDISYVNLIIVSIVGSTLTTGTISAFNFANNIQAVPLGIFALSTTLAVFPLLSEQYAKKEIESFINTFNKAFVRILYFIMPAAAIILLLRAYLVRLLIGYGKCDWTCTITTFDALGVLSFSLIAQSLIPLLSRAFYARQNTKTPVIIGLIAMAINGVLSYYLSFHLGIIGIAFGFLVAAAFQVLMLFSFLHRSLGKELVNRTNESHLIQKDYYILVNLVKIALSCLLTAVSCYGALYVIDNFVDTHTIIGILIQLVFALGISGLVYLLTTAKMGVPDAVQIKNSLAKMGQFSNVSNVE